jgi:hypothetical protein
MSFSAGMVGQAITGQLLVTDRVVRIEVLLPGFSSALAQGIGEWVERQGRLLLERK